MTGVHARAALHPEGGTRVLFGIDGLGLWMRSDAAGAFADQLTKHLSLDVPGAVVYIALPGGTEATVTIADRPLGRSASFNVTRPDGALHAATVPIHEAKSVAGDLAKAAAEAAADGW